MRAFVVGTIFGSEIVCNDPAGFGQNDAVCFVEGILQFDVLERFLLPLKHYAYEKLRYKLAWLFYLSERIRNSIDAKIKKERRSVDPVLFVSQKRYMLFVLEKN